MFDRVLRFDDAILLAARIKIQPKNLNLEGSCTATLEGSISKKMLHQVAGHAEQQLLRDTPKYYGVNVTGIVTKCLSCSLEKIRQKNIPKKNESTAETPVERMYLDISSMKDESLGGRRHWAMLVDEATRCKHSFFLKKKSDQVDMVSSWLKGLKNKYKIQVEFIGCDNAGENKKLEEKCDAEGLGIIFEYTATGTPQQNAYVERAFPTLMGRAGAMMNCAGFTTEKRNQLWCEAANTATMLDSILVHEQNSAPPYTMFYGKDAKYAKHL